MENIYAWIPFFERFSIVNAGVFPSTLCTITYLFTWSMIFMWYFRALCNFVISSRNDTRIMQALKPPLIAFKYTPSACKWVLTVPFNKKACLNSKGCWYSLFSLDSNYLGYIIYFVIYPGWYTTNSYSITHKHWHW